MKKQTIYLFVRALVIGVVLNVLIYQVSDISLSQQEVISSQEAPHTPSQSSSNTEVYFLNQTDN